MPLLLTDRDVRELLPIHDAIDAAEMALKEYQSGKAENLPRQHFYAGNGTNRFFMRSFQGALPALNVAGRCRSRQENLRIIAWVRQRPNRRETGARGRLRLVSCGTGAGLRC